MSTPRLLSDSLPLRRSTDLPGFRVDAVLPWAYGRVTLAPVPLDDSGLEWLLADHPIVALHRVTAGGEAVTGWQLVQRVDATGAAIATLRLTQAPKAGATLAAEITGRRHPTTGAALEHPADIAADVLRQCGWQVPVDAFRGLRDDYPGLALGLVLDSPVRLREAVAAIVEPLGAIWTANPLAARRAGARTPVGTLDAMAADEIRARSDHGSLATVARVTFAHDWASGQPRQALTLSAPDAIKLYGRIEAELAMPAVRTARDALAIGTAILADRARPQWSITAQAASSALSAEVADTLTLAHPWVPEGAAVVIALERNTEQGTRSYTLAMPAGAAPRVVLDRRSQAIDPAAPEPGSILYRDGTATFTISDDTGNPLANAAVTLDGADTRNTDRTGRVQFKTERGPHTLTVFLAGYAPFELDVVV